MRPGQAPSLDTYLLNNREAIDDLLDLFPDIRSIIENPANTWTLKREMYFAFFYLHQHNILETDNPGAFTTKLVTFLCDLFNYSIEKNSKSFLNRLRTMLPAMHEIHSLTRENMLALINVRGTQQKTYLINIISRASKETFFTQEKFSDILGMLCNPQLNHLIFYILKKLDAATTAESLPPKTTYWELLFSPNLFDRDNILLLRQIMETLEEQNLLNTADIETIFIKIQTLFENALAMERQDLAPDVITLGSMNLALQACLDELEKNAAQSSDSECETPKSTQVNRYSLFENAEEARLPPSSNTTLRPKK